MFAHGVRKVFFHAGTCQGFHDSSTGNMFFEYGGAPRKMYPAVAAMARLLAPDFQFVRKWDKPEWTARLRVPLPRPHGGDSMDPQGRRAEAGTCRKGFRRWTSWAIPWRTRRWSPGSRRYIWSASRFASTSRRSRFGPRVAWSLTILMQGNGVRLGNDSL